MYTVASSCISWMLNSFQNMLRQQEELENGAAWSISSESSDDSSSPQLSGSARHTLHRPVVQPAVQAVAPAIEIAFTQPEDKELPVLQEEVVAVANGHVPYARTLSQISEASVDLPVAEDKERPIPRNSSPKELPLQETNTLPQTVDSVQDDAAQVSEEEELKAEPDEITPIAEVSEDMASPSPDVHHPRLTLSFPAAPKQLQLTSVSEPTRPRPVECGLEESINSLASALDDYRGQFPELQTLEQQLKHLEEIILVCEGEGALLRERKVTANICIFGADIIIVTPINGTKPSQILRCQDPSNQN